MTSGKLAKNSHKSNRVHRQNGSASGGSKLKRLRESKKLSQLELDLIIAQSNYSRIERGLSKPSKEKLDAILDAFDASFNDRQDILKSFGYLPPYPLPDHKETEAIRQRCQPILDELPIPAYLTDLVTRLVAWNPLFAKLTGGMRDTLTQLKGEPLFKAQFASRLGLRQLMEGVEEILRIDVYGIYDRLAPHSHEKWYQDFIEELCEDPNFQHYWDEVVALGPLDPAPVSFANHILHPRRFYLSNEGSAVLTFYANYEVLQNDSRFQMIYLVPADPMTIRQLERW